MNTFNKIMGVCATILISIIVFFFGVKIKDEGNPNNIYKVYLNGESIGLIEDKEELLDFYSIGKIYRNE